MKTLILRSITGIVYVGLICASVLSGGWLFIVFFGLIAILALEEFYNLTNASTGGENVTTLIIDVAGGLILCVGLGCVNTGVLTPFTTTCLGGLFYYISAIYDSPTCHAAV